jgi:uncharacterized protein YlxW (UPF0749 family)
MGEKEVLNSHLRGWRPHLRLKPKDWVAPLTAASLVLGMLLALQFGSQKSAGELAGRPRVELLAQLLAAERKRIKDLDSEIVKLRSEKSKYEKAATEGKQVLTLMNKDNEMYKVALGLTPVVGPGIIVRVADSELPHEAGAAADEFLIHDFDLWPIVNDLRSAGAEAVAIGDQRVVGTTAITCVGRLVKVNDAPLSPPYEIKAIGSIKELTGALTIKDGVLDRLKAQRFPVNLEQGENIYIPAVSVGPKIKFAKPTKEAPK